MAETDFFLSLAIDAIKAGTPLLLATTGEIYAERSGILNLGVEGAMIMGAFVAFMTSHFTGNVALALLLAMMVGALMSLIHGILSISLRANQIVAGIALTLFGLGLSGFFGRPLIGLTAPRLSPTPVPLLSDVPFLGPLVFSHDVIVYASLVLTVVLWFILFKTRVGLSIRAVGENPAMADALGVNVYLTRYVCTLTGGALAALGGAYLSVVYTPLWIEGMTAGRGWIAIALTTFASWNPLRALLGAYLFGGVSVLQFRLQAIGVGTEAPQFLLMLPYIVTILALSIISTESIRKRIGFPASLAVPYVRGES